MPDIMDFQEALKETEGKDRTLLLGNGFSGGLGHFHYQSLLEQAEIPADSGARKLFDRLGTADFEYIIRALEGASMVDEAYGRKDIADQILADAQMVRDALVKAVHATHPKNREELQQHYNKALQFLTSFRSLFTLNYDLLLYWIVIEHRGRFADGFGLGEIKDGGAFRGPFTDDAHCDMFNLHGGLHLFQDSIGDTWKAVNVGNGVIDVVANAISTQGSLPLYVAEGTTEQKQARINSSVYLRHCYDKLRDNAAPVFIFGHSADDSDTHIYRAIFGSKVDQIYFGAFQADQNEINRLRGQISRHQEAAGSKASIAFFRSESVDLWTLP